MKYLSMAIVLASLICLSCSTKKNLSLSDYRGKRIEFGSGGGFSGYETKYVLLDNGELYKIPLQGEDKKELIATVPEKERSQVFKNYKVLNLENLELNDPGNHYYFVRYKTRRDSNNIVWSRTDVKELQVFHKILHNYTK